MINSIRDEIAKSELIAQSLFQLKALSQEILLLKNVGKRLNGKMNFKY